MLKLTLDTNCIVALDENREPAANSLRRLLAAHAAGTAQLRLVANSASERQRTGPYLENFSQFQQRLADLDLDHLEILRPPATLDVAYRDQMVLLGDDELLLLERIHTALFPTHPFELQNAINATPPGSDPEAIERKWRNRRLDAEAMWCHIHYEGDVFVTTDDNFFKETKKPQLAALGAPLILTPSQAEAHVQQDGPNTS
jgi:hypothetical protein